MNSFLHKELFQLTFQINRIDGFWWVVQLQVSSKIRQISIWFPLVSTNYCTAPTDSQWWHSSYSPTGVKLNKWSSSGGCSSSSGSNGLIFPVIWRKTVLDIFWWIYMSLFSITYITAVWAAWHLFLYHCVWHLCLRICRLIHEQINSLLGTVFLLINEGVLLGSHSSLSLSSPGIVSLISLVILSYDRYSTLTVYNKRGPSYRKPLLAVSGSWLYSLLWTVPPLVGWSSYGIEGAGTSCSVSWTVRTAESHAYIICLFIFCLGLPILVMIYCYGRLLWAVKQVKRENYCENGLNYAWCSGRKIFH